MIKKKIILSAFIVVNLILLILLQSFNALYLYLFALLTVVVFLRVMNSKSLTFIIVMILTYFIYIGFMFYHNYVSPLPSSGNDDLRFELLADNYFYAWQADTEPYIFQNSTFYSQLLAVIYFIFGKNILIAGYLNIILHIYSCCILLKIINKVVDKYQNILISLYSFNIFHILNTVITLREMFIIFLIILYVYTLMNFLKEEKFKFIIYSIIVSLVASLFHIGLVSLIGFSGIVYSLFSKRSWLLRLIIACITLFIVSIIFFTSDDSKLDLVQKKDDVLAMDVIESRTDYIIVEPPSLILKPLYIIAKTFFFLDKPFFWDISNVSDVLAYFEKLLYLIPIFLYIIKNKYFRHNDYINILILLVIFLSVIYGMGTENYGTAIRHREKFVYLLYIIPIYYILSKEREFT
ncbi:hypothetical protein [Macrococcus brunensis]|uniref:hypothetical protein n=1 Tax=Macrococcus brunensis TaxID=198483 RepID=UPI001EF0852F|nr:hypothetical protein [Macrococcus brunensis]ULG72697.1 hypothetical protein MGG12_04040 [Macrococcus brunensis]